VAAASSLDTGAPGDMRVLVATAADSSSYTLLADGAGVYAPSVLSALSGPAGNPPESEQSAAGTVLGQLGAHLRKREYTAEEREKRKLQRADVKINAGRREGGAQ